MGEIQPAQASALEKVLLKGDLSGLSEAERLAYYRAVCESLGLNPLTQPFQYLHLNGRLVLYATRAAADQLRAIHGLSAEIVSQQQVGDLYIVHVRVRDREGRTDEDLGIVSLVDAHGQPLLGDALANAILKAITKAKRRATLSLCGLGMLDETEVETIPEARPEPSLEVPAETEARRRLWRRWDELCQEARALGITPPALPRTATDEEIIQAGVGLKKQITEKKKGGDQ